jgi:hypothetical protein
MFIFIPFLIWLVYIVYSLSRRRSEYNKIKEMFFKVSSRIPELRVYYSGIFMNKPSLSGTVKNNVISLECLPGLVHSIDIHIRIHDEVPYYMQISDRITKENDKISLITTSDEEFNNKIFIFSSYEAGVIAFMDNDTRKLMYTLISITNLFNLESDTISFRIPYSLKNMKLTEYLIKKALQCTFTLVTKMTRQENIKDLLTYNTLYDPDPAVRLKNLEILITRFKLQDLALTLNKVLDDQDMHIRYKAADRLGLAGVPALYNLFNEIPPEDISFQRKIVTSIARIEGMKSMQFVISFYNTLQTNEDKVKIIYLFEKYGDEQANKILLDILKDNNTYELKLAVIRALGQCGSMDAVAPLYSLTKQIMSLPSLRSAAKHSIARIQSRYEPGEKGWLTLTTDTEQLKGSLSITETDSKKEK